MQKEILIDDFESVIKESTNIIQEKIFGGKTAKKEQSEDKEITPEYIDAVIESVHQSAQRVVIKFVNSEIDKVITNIKQQNPLAFKKYIIGEFGEDNEKLLKSKFLGDFWRQVATDEGVMDTTIDKEAEAKADATWSDTKSKEPFVRAFRDSLFNKDNFRDPESILESEFHSDMRELDQLWEAYRKLVSEKGKERRTGGISDDSVILRIMTLKLSQILVGYYILSNDYQLTKNYFGGDDAATKAFFEKQKDALNKKYTPFFGASNIEAKELYSELKAKSPSEYKESGLNPYEIAVEKISQEIKDLTEKHKKKAEQELESTETKKAWEKALGVLEDEDSVEDEESPYTEPEAEPESPDSESTPATEKEEEIEFSQNRHHQRQILMLSAAQKAVSTIENPEKILNFTKDDFRDMKTIFAYNNPYKEPEKKKKFQEQMLSATKKEFMVFLKNLQKNSKALSAFINNWNEQKMIDGKLSVTLPKGEQGHGTEEPTAQAETQAQTKTETEPKEEKVKPQAPSKKTSKIGLTPEEEEEAAMQSSKGIEEYLKSEEGKNAFKI